jgi:hypothetical protein
MAKRKTYFGYGNRTTKIAHTNNSDTDQCRISEIRPTNRNYFTTEEEFTNALEANGGDYSPCKICANEYIQPE